MREMEKTAGTWILQLFGSDPYALDGTLRWFNKPITCVYILIWVFKEAFKNQR